MPDLLVGPHLGTVEEEVEVECPGAPAPLADATVVRLDLVQSGKHGFTTLSAFDKDRRIDEIGPGAYWKCRRPIEPRNGDNCPHHSRNFANRRNNSLRRTAEM